MKNRIFALAMLVSAAIQAQSQTTPRVEPVFPTAPPGLVYIEGEEAVSTSFAREPTLDYSSSGQRTLLLNREPGAAGAPFYAEYAFVAEEAGSYALWIGGTPPGPRSDLAPSYSSPFIVRLDSSETRPLYREDVTVAEAYSPTNFWFAAARPFTLSKGSHTLRIEISERRRYDSRYYCALDALFFLKEGSPLPFPRTSADPVRDRPQLSIAQYEARLQTEPRNRDLYLELAKVYGLLGEHDNALKILSRGRLVAGDDPRFYLLSAKNRIWSGEANEGLRLYREYLASPDSDGALWAEAAKVAAWLARYPESLALYREALSRFPGDLNLSVNYGLTYLWAGQVKEGEAVLAKAQTDASGDPGTIKALASIYFINGYPSEAREIYDQGIELFPDDLELYLLACRTALSVGDEAGAAATQAAIRQRFTPSERLDALLENLGLRAGARRTAIARYEERLAASPDDLELRRELVRAYYWNGSLEEAVAGGNDILVNELYRVFLDLERDLAETWRSLDILAVYRTKLPAAASTSKTAAAALGAARGAYGKARDEAAKAASSKDTARRERADAALAAAEATLARAYADAERTDSWASAFLAAASDAFQAAAAEAARKDADDEILSKLNSWTWARDADITDLAVRTAHGNTLARAVLDRLDLVERRPQAVLSRAQTATAAAPLSDSPEPPALLPSELRSRIQARLWMSGTLPEEGLPPGLYFAHGPALARWMSSLSPPEPEASVSPDALVPGTSADSRTPFDPDLPEKARTLEAALAGYTAAVPPALDALGSGVNALHARAAVRMRLRFYQHDTESTADRRELADAFLKLDRPGQAIPQLERLLSAAPGDLDASFTLGRAYELSGDWSGAMKRYRLVYSTDPKFQNTATSYNKLARAHADRISSDLTSFVDSSRTNARGRIEYASGGTSLVDFGVVYTLDNLRVHSPREGSVPAAAGLQSLDLNLNFSFPRLGTTLFGTVGGTVKSRLWSEPSSAVEPFEPGDFFGVLASSLKLGAGARWAESPWVASVSWTFDQIKDSFLPGRDSWYEHAGEANLSAWFDLSGPWLLRSAGLRAYGRAAYVFSPFAAGTNFLYTGILEANTGLLLSGSPWTILQIGGSFLAEGSRDPDADDYYSPDGVLCAKGGFGISTWLGTGKAWVTGLSGRLWAGVWSDADNAWPTVEAQIRAELSKGDYRLFVEIAGARTGGGASAEYWSLNASLGASVAVPDYLIP